jgi:hypothetical protein
MMAQIISFFFFYLRTAAPQQREERHKNVPSSIGVRGVDEERAAYVRQVAHAVRSGGHTIVSTFGPRVPRSAVDSTWHVTMQNRCMSNRRSVPTRGHREGITSDSIRYDAEMAGIGIRGLMPTLFFQTTEYSIAPFGWGFYSPRCAYYAPFYGGHFYHHFSPYNSAWGREAHYGLPANYGHGVVIWSDGERPADAVWCGGNGRGDGDMGVPAIGAACGRADPMTSLRAE